MTLKGDCRDELLVADVTLERFHPSVPSHVRLQLYLGAERLVALIAFKRFVSGVHGLQKKIKRPDIISNLLKVNNSNSVIHRNNSKPKNVA